MTSDYIQNLNYKKEKILTIFIIRISIYVGPLGLEPRLFGTKNQRVASYTMGQCLIEGANLEQSFICTSIF